jgi:cytochrome P450
MLETLDAPTAILPKSTRPAAPIPKPRPPGLLAALMALRTNPIDALSERAFRDPFVTITFRRPMLLVNDPTAVAHILLDHAANYRKSPEQQRRLTPALGRGLLTAEGDDWRTTRRAVAPLFTPKAVDQMLPAMEGAIHDLVARWRGRPPSQPFDIADDFQQLAYDMLSCALFSRSIDGERRALRAHMTTYFRLIGRLDFVRVLGLPAWWPSLARLRSSEAIAYFRAAANRLEDSRRNAIGPREGGPFDLIDNLIASDGLDAGACPRASRAEGLPGSAPEQRFSPALPPGAVADNILTFLAAGHETTGIALAWTFYLLALFPDAAAMARREIATIGKAEHVEPEALESLVFCKAVIQEAMRLYPPAPFVGRQAIGEDMVGGHRIAPGDEVLVSPWTLHRHQTLWARPDAFHPERFMPNAARIIPRGAYIPFGMGPRNCIGQTFAMREMLLALAHLLPAFDFELVAPERVYPKAEITLRPRNGIAMRILPRQDPM